MEKLKRESSEMSFGESESVSSLSEKDSQLQPLESHEDEDLKTLTEKLSAALANVRLKDDLVKQHVKVAEEAVCGWEKAENEVIELKEKLEVADDKNRVLEDRVNHLDGALKECVKQLRQARDEQEERIHDAVIERTRELQSYKTSLENEILEAATKSEELRRMAESVAKENVMLRHELLARCEELEIRTIERDLSTQVAETASKQQLDSIKKVAKLEAECRKLRMLAKSSALLNDHQSADSYSDGGERIEVSCSESWASSTLIEKRSLQGTSSFVEIDLMGDFLEMERLVALPETPDGPETVTKEDEVHSKNSMADGIEVCTSRIKELEEKLEKLEAEKDELESEAKSNREEAVVHLENSLAAEVELWTSRIKELEEKLKKLEEEKDELESEASNREEAVVHKENSLATEIEVWTSRTKELEEKLEKLEAEKDELETEVKSNREEKSTLRFELEAIAYDKMELENKLEKMEVEKVELKISFDIIKDKYKESKLCLQETQTRLEKIQTEMKLADEVKAEAESQIIAMEAEAKTKCEKIKSLEVDMRKERLAFDELRRKCEALEEEVSLHRENTIKSENIDLKIKQEDIETAAEKLVNCQKTIASLGKQLQSLATLEDFMIGTAIIRKAANGVTCSRYSESWKVHTKEETFMARNYPDQFIKPTIETDPSSSSSSSYASALAVSTPVSSNRGSSEKNRNGFATVFTRSKDGIHMEI